MTETNLRSKPTPESLLRARLYQSMADDAEHKLSIALRKLTKETKKLMKAGALEDMPVWLTPEVGEKLKKWCATLDVPPHVLIVALVDDLLDFDLLDFPPGKKELFPSKLRIGLPRRLERRDAKRGSGAAPVTKGGWPH
jgi:hypothetical protein